MVVLYVKIQTVEKYCSNQQYNMSQQIANIKVKHVFNF